LQAQIVIHRNGDLLIRAQIPFCRLDRRGPEQEFDLFEIPAVLLAQLGAGPPKVMGAELLEPDLLR